MTTRLMLVLALAAGCAAVPFVGAAQPGAEFRGPGGSGRYAIEGLPTAWNEAREEGIRWKVGLPLAGWSTPVVWEDRVIVTSADPEKRVVQCFAVKDGSELWNVELPVVDGLTEDYATDTMDGAWDARMYAGAAPVSDGKQVYAIFSNGQLAALKLEDGAVVWNLAVGQTSGNAYGLTSALRLFGDTLIVTVEGDENFVAGYDAATGVERWKSSRKNSTWASPILIKTAGGKDQLVLLADPDATAWDPATGKELWSIDILVDTPEWCVGPSPIFNGAYVFVNSQNGGLHAIDPDKGEKVWGVEELPEAMGFSDGPSMLVDDKYVYQFFGGYLTCLNAATGEVVKDQEMDEEATYASPFLNGGILYLIGQGGTLVVKADPEAGFPLVGKGVLRESIEATPAVSPAGIFLRADNALYCIGM